jgi:hypothetical protein
MNDRISNKPPTTYIGEEEFLERYEREKGDIRGRKMARPKIMHHPNTSTVGSYADRSDLSNRSSIFRFGKSLAASFNPSNWRIFSKVPEEIEESAEQQILRERREKAESMYKELKKSGHFRDSTFGPSLFQQQEEKVPMPTKHDSGVEFGERRSRSFSRGRMSRETSREAKRMGRVFLEPPPIPTGSESHFSHSPASTQESSHKGKFHFKKPSLSNIRKSTNDNGSNAGNHHQARRIPSRKDLQKQQKLVKRVSDLEGKLEAARRQLAEALDEPVPSGPPPRRQRFVPGAMPSLPSERLLSGFGDSDAGMRESVSISQIGKALTRNDSENFELDEPSRRAPSPPNFDKTLPLEPETPASDRAMQSIEVEDDSDDMEDPPTETERPEVQSVKSRETQVIQQLAASASHLSDDSSDEPTDPEDSDFEYSESGKHETSPEPSEISKLTAPQPFSKPQPSKQQTSKSKKRKNVSDCDPTGEETFQPVLESESDLSYVRPKRTPKKIIAGNPPRKLQKISNAKTSPPSQRNGVPQRHQLTPGKKQSSVSSRHSKSKIAGKDPQSVSPPPSSQFTGLEYMKPSSGAKEARIATYSATSPADGEDVPPMPKIPKEFRLASGEVVSIPAQKGHDHVSGASVGKSQQTGTPSKLTKARPTPSPKKGGEKKEHFEWPEDVF